MTMFTRTAATIALVITALCIPSAVNATYSGSHAARAPQTAQATEARKAYIARRALEIRKTDVRAQDTRKTLLAVMVTLQTGCDASCTMTR